MIEPKIFTVGQINRYIKNLLENDFILCSLLVKGEISNFKAHSSGHFYFTLKDAAGAIACIMFRQDAERMPFIPENGMEVVLYGHISLYEKTGQYQLYAEFMDPVGVGSLQIAYEQLKQRLQEEGLFDDDFKRELPARAEVIAVITSPTGAAIRDILQIIKRRDPAVQVAVFPTLVQGENAAADIVRSLRLANEWGKADVIILGRGGGSIEDLWAFNEEQVARAIFASETPVISAVGHETDFTIADFVADLRAPTPSAAAELATVPRIQHYQQLEQLEGRLRRSAEGVVSQAVRRLQYLQERPILKRPLERIYQALFLLEEREKSLKRDMNQRFLRCGETLAMLETRLHAASPLSLMQRGYIMATKANGKALTSVNEVEADELLQLRLRDGRLKVRILEKAVTDYGKEKNNL